MNDWKFNLRVLDDDIKCFTIPTFEKYKFLKHCFTTRIGGVSKSPYNTLNLGTKTNDDKSDLTINFKKICNALNIDLKDVVISDQVHSDKILKVTEEHKSNGNIFTNKISDIDGLITNIKNIALVTLYADCVPLFIFDPVKKAIGLSHAGWRGTLKKIGKKTVEEMIKEFNSDPKDLLVGIAPSIGQCCYEVDKNIFNEFKKEYYNLENVFLEKDNGKFLLNLWEANRKSLLEAGVLEKNITISNICTNCNNDLLYSYRGDKGVTGRMAAIMQLV